MLVAKYTHATSLDLSFGQTQRLFSIPPFLISLQLLMLLSILSFQSFWDNEPSQFSTCIGVHVLFLTDVFYLSPFTQLWVNSCYRWNPAQPYGNGPRVAC